MSLAENISERLSYKFYSDGVITPGSEPDPASAPGASGAQQLRFVSQTVSLAKDTYQSTEKRTDRQIADFRHGTRRAQGAVNGLLSALTYADWFEAALRGTWAAGFSGGPSAFTSVAADNSTSKFTLGGGDPVASGLRVGMPIRFTGLSDAQNNDRVFVVTAIGGANNREVTVYPAPDTMTADTSFAVAQAGMRVFAPSTGHVSRKLALESYQDDIDVAILATELRLGGFNIGLPASGNATVDFSLLGRNERIYEDTDAPFFSSPTAQTNTGLFTAVNGLLMANGVAVAVLTGLQITLDLAANGPAVVGSNLVPEIFLGAANVTGNFTAFFENADLIANFQDEDEISLLAYVTATNDADPEAMTVYLPRLKLGGAQRGDDGSGGRVVQYPFQALKYVGAGPGIEQTTIQLCDTEVS
ncbi:MAG: phage tail tube protein [Alphaproteobacteria bacterium]